MRGVFGNLSNRRWNGAIADGPGVRLALPCWPNDVAMTEEALVARHVVGQGLADVVVWGGGGSLAARRAFLCRSSCWLAAISLHREKHHYEQQFHRTVPRHQ